MNLRPKTLSIVLAAAALAGLGSAVTAPMATAATTGSTTGHRSASSATPTGKAELRTNAALSDSPTDTSDGTTNLVHVYQAGLDGLESTHIPGFTCPSSQPWLDDQQLENRNVPKGVLVDEPGGVGVDIPVVSTDANGRVTGWRDGASATNWTLSYQYLQISARCTSDPIRTYQG